MPQMAPISWFLLFLMFFITFIMFNIMNYYNYIPNTPSHQKKSSTMFNMNWKW